MCPPMPVAQVLTLFINHVQDDFILNNGNKYFKYNDAKRHFFYHLTRKSVKNDHLTHLTSTMVKKKDSYPTYFNEKMTFSLK